MADPPFHSFPPPADSSAELLGDEDDVLMARTREGDRDAFATLVRRYGSRLAKYTSKLTSSPRLGVELANETWLGVWAHAARYPGDGRFIPFVLTIAKRKATGAITKSQPDAPGPDIEALDIEAQLATILERLDDPEIHALAAREAAALGTKPPKAGSGRPWRWLVALGGVVVLVACLVFFVRAILTPKGSGGSLAKDVTVKVYTGGHPLTDGAKVDKKTDLGAAYTSTYARRAYVLVFAIDASKEIHWIAPAFSDPTQDPTAVEIERADLEKPLRSSVTFEGLGEGKGSVFAIVTERLVRVSDMERMPSTERTSDQIKKRFSDGAVHEWKIVVTRKK